MKMEQLPGAAELLGRLVRLPSAVFEYAGFSEIDALRLRLDLALLLLDMAPPAADAPIGGSAVAALPPAMPAVPAPPAPAFVGHELSAEQRLEIALADARQRRALANAAGERERSPATFWVIDCNGRFATPERPELGDAGAPSFTPLIGEAARYASPEDANLVLARWRSRPDAARVVRRDAA